MRRKALRSFFYPRSVAPFWRRNQQLQKCLLFVPAIKYRCSGQYPSQCSPDPGLTMLFSSFSSPLLLLLLSILGSDALPRQVEVVGDDAVEAPVADNLQIQTLAYRDDDDDDSKIHEFKGNLTDIEGGGEEEDRIVGGFVAGNGQFPHMVSLEPDGLGR